MTKLRKGKGRFHTTPKTLSLNYDRIDELRDEVCEQSHVSNIDFFIREKYGCPQEVRHYFYYRVIMDGFRNVDIVKYMVKNGFIVKPPGVIYGIMKFEKFFAKQSEQKSK